jgi:Tol biopolymer transport system component
MRAPAQRALAILLLAAPAVRAGQITLPYRVPPPRSSDTAAGTSRPVSFSADGRYLVFLSDAPNLVPGQVDYNLSDDVFLYDRATGTTTLVSHAAASPTTAAGLGSESPVISADGRFVAFASAAQDLTLTRDPGTLRDVFLWDRLSGVVTLASRPPGAGIPGDGESYQPSISGDGRYVVFTSAAKNLVSRVSDFNQAPDVFLFDRQAGRVSLVSRSATSASQAGDRFADSPVISRDGRYVAYLSNSTNVVAGESGTGLYNRAVYVYDRVAGTTVLASHRAGSRTALASQESMLPQISANGDVVAYLSYAVDLVAGQVDDNLHPDLFLFYRPSGVNTLVSHAAGAPARASGEGVDGLFALSADGAYVAFTAEPSDLLPGGAQGGGDNVFLFERRSGAVTLMSRSTASPSQAGGYQSALGSIAISDDGGQAAFWSSASDLAASSPEGPGVFVYDRRSGSLQRAGTATSPDSGVTLVTPVLSGDGAWTAFSSVQPETEGGLRDLNGRGDLYLYGRSLGGAELISRRDPGLPSKTPAGESRPGGLSDDGRYAVLTSEGGNVLPRVTDGNGGEDVLLYDRTLKTTTLVSRSFATSQKTGNAPSFSPRLSADGRYVAYLSDATDLTADATTPGLFNQNVLVYDRVSGANTLVTRPAIPGKPSGRASDVVISADGSTLAVTSSEGWLLPGQTGDNIDDQIFLFNRATGSVSLVTHAFGSPTALSKGGGIGASISADGRFVAFYSRATDLLQTPLEEDSLGVYLYDRSTGTVSRVADLGFELQSGRFPTAMSRDGLYIAFASESETLVPGQIDRQYTVDLFLYDRTTRSIRLVSHAPNSPLTAAGGASGQVELSADGRLLVFDSYGIPVTGQRNPGNDKGVFVYDVASGGLTAMGTGNASFGGPDTLAVSPNGRYVAFLDLPLWRSAPGGPGVSEDVYLYDRTTRQLTLVSAAGAAPANGTSDGPLFVSDTGVVLFASAASNLVPGDFNDGFPGLKDVFLYSSTP